MSEARVDIFLSGSQADRYALYRRIQGLTAQRLSTPQWLDAYHDKALAVTDVNLRQIAAATGRNYGSIYNMYNDLVAVLQRLTGEQTTDVQTLFQVPAGRVRYDFVQHSNSFAFLQALLAKSYTRFEDFLTAQDTSKVTMLRHLKPLRELANHLGVRLHYEKMTVSGDERRIRLFLTVAYWLATDGAAWPFNHDHEMVGEVTDAIYQTFDIRFANAVSRELGNYYLAVAVERIEQGNIVNYDPDQTVLNYPVPNLYSELTAKFGKILPLTDQNMNRQSQLGESAYLYFLSNFAPMFITPDSTESAEVIARFSRYNPEIYTLATEFLAKIPAKQLDVRNLPKPIYELLLANLLSVTISTMTFGGDISAILSAALSRDMNVIPDDLDFQRKVRQTLENVIATEPQTASFGPLIDELSDSYYINFRQLVARFAPTYTVRVLPLLEQTALGYIDLYAFLFNQPFVTVLSPGASVADADVVIQAASVPIDESQCGDAVLFRWDFNANVDRYGSLYALLREIWLRREKAVAEQVAKGTEPTV